MLHNQSEYYAGMLNKVAAETENLYKERDKIVAQTAELQENVVQMRFDRYIRSREFELACRNLEQQIKESDSRIAVNYQDVKASVATTMATVLNLNADTRYKIQLRRNESLREIGIEINNDFASFNFDQAKKLKSYETPYGHQHYQP
jgi:hypothetical protein